MAAQQIVDTSKIKTEPSNSLCNSQKNIKVNLRPKKSRYGLQKKILEYAGTGKKLFQKNWLSLPEFSDWVREASSCDKAYCRYCKSEFNASKKQLELHSKSRKHLKNSAHKEATAKDLDITTLLDEDGNEHSLSLIDLRVDSSKKLLLETKNQMLSVNAGDVALDTHTVVKELEQKVQSLVGKESAVYIPTTQMANLVAVLAHCTKGSSLLLGDDSQIWKSSKSMLFSTGGLHCIPLKTKEDGSFCLDEIDVQFSNLKYNPIGSKLLCIEVAHLNKGGRIPDINWIQMVSNSCICYGSQLHCDGSYLLNACVSNGESVRMMVDGCDSVTLGLESIDGSQVGAVLAGTTQFVQKATLLRNMLGGCIHQADMLAASALHALESFVIRIENVHGFAKSVALRIEKESSYLIFVEMCEVQTNIVHVHTNSNLISAKELAERLTSVTDAESLDLEDQIIIMATEVSPDMLSFVLHSSIKASDVRAICEKMSYVIKEYESRY